MKKWMLGRKTGTTCLSDEDWYEELDRQARRAEKRRMFLVSMLVGSIAAATLWAILWGVVRGMGHGRYDPWAEALRAAR